MLRTSIAIVFTAALCANAVAAPKPASLQTRSVSLTKRAHVLPFTAAERLIMDRASAKWDGPGGGGDGGSAN